MDIPKLINSMTLAEKVGQLFMLAFASNNLEEARVLIEEHFVCGSYISNDNVPSAEAAVSLVTKLQEFARNTRLKLPLLLAPDQEGTWAVMVPDSCPGPGNMALGATHNDENAYKMYKTIAQELKAVGLNAPFCPCADCNSNPHNSIIGMRSFGEKPDLVADMTAAAIRGFKDGGVIATLKHFPGHGDTTLDSHRGLPQVNRTREELFAIDLLPFAEGIKAGADIVMTSHIIYSALDKERPATLSPLILQDLLRKDLGFEGVIVSDSMNMHSMKKNYDPADSAIQAINAGVDIIMLAEEHYDHNKSTYLKNQLELINAVKQAVENGSIAMSRLDDAVERILKLKANLVDMPLDAGIVGLEEHRAVELEVSRAAVAILKDEAKLVPIAKDKSVLLINTTTRASYEVLGNIRGVGPNQTVAAFDYFVEAMQASFPTLRTLEAEAVLKKDALALDADVVIAVTENHTLPGMDFDQESQAMVINSLAKTSPDKLLVVALRDPYELSYLENIPSYVCAFSFRPCAARAAAELLAGHIEAKGKSPVTVPNTRITA